MVAVAINWTTVLVYAVPAYIAAFGGCIAAWRGTQNRNSLQVPSGGTIGQKVETTHDLAAVGVAAVTGVNNADTQKAVAKLNDNPASPVTIPNGPLTGQEAK